LRADEKGRATFVILDRLPDTAGPAAPGTGTPLISLVTLEDDRYASLARMLLGGWALLDDPNDLDAVSGQAAGDGSRYVTADGQWGGAGGMLHAGSPASDASPVASRISRQEQLKAVRASIDEHEAAVEIARSRHEEVAARLEAIDIDGLESRVAELRRQATDLEKASSRAEHEQEVYERQIRSLEDRLESLRSQREETASGMETAAAEVKRLTVQVAEIQQKCTDAESAFEGIEEASREAFSLFNEANVASVQIRNRLDNLRRDRKRTEEDLEALAQAATERTRSLETLAQQKGELEERCSELQDSIRTLQDERGALDDTVSEAKDALMETKVEISELEARLREQRRDREQTMKEENRLAVQAASIETRLNDLIADIEEDFEIDLTTYETDVPEDFSRDEAREEIRELRGRIKRLGPVNELALDSFEEEKQRLDFMREQLDDLEKAEKTLVSTIDEINTTASRRFNETFAAIQEHFSKLFADLFGEDAKATVELADPDDPLESAIEIFAKPRGKKPSVLAQLSGGEKTLTAIALLFAIYLVKPSPFCILDEVDAPLDDANINRFMNLIRSFAESTQFILVTHNKKTMEAADRMYGITMQEQGVSKLVGVSFEDESDLELVA
ncbi:MAG: AAA family ATPase, partial [Rhodothermales bacterium]|nr:AAA family ATPase [Rhodothermales bacterium]